MSGSSYAVAIGGMLAVVGGKYLYACGVPSASHKFRLPRRMMSVEYSLVNLALLPLLLFALPGE